VHYVVLDDELPSEIPVWCRSPLRYPLSVADVIIMGVRRTNPGRVRLYTEAAQVLRENRRDLVMVWLSVLAVVVLLNMLPLNAWATGAASGALITFLVCMTYWSTWYASGLGNRLAGTWAEGFTSEELAKTTSSMHVIPSLRFDGFDIDHAVVARHGVYAIETKHHHRFYGDVLARDARQAARAGRTLRLALTKGRHPVLPEAALFHTVLVIWGRAARELEPTVLVTDFGPMTVLSGRALVGWLNARPRGGLTSESVAQLVQHLEETAATRESAQAPQPWWIRRLARVS